MAVMRIRLQRLAWLLLVLPLATLASEWSFDDAERVVALSDIHGAYDAMVRTLQQTAVIDESGDWIGGGTHVVIVGDLLDRGPDSRSAMDHLMRLEPQAEAAGGGAVPPVACRLHRQVYPETELQAIDSQDRAGHPGY